MKLKENLRYYLIFALIFLFGASFAAGLFFSYRIELQPPLYGVAGIRLNFGNYLHLVAVLLQPLVLTFLAAFTIYACPLAMLSTLLIGIHAGELLIAYCLSEHNPFTHIAVLVFLLALGTVFTIFSTKTAHYRNTLRAIAPDPVPLMKAKHTAIYFHVFLSSALIIMSVSLAIYFLAIYFPL